MIYGFVGARLHGSTSAFDNVLTGTAEFGSLFNLSDSLILGVRGKSWIDVSSGDSEWVGAVDLAINPEGRFDIRMGFERQDNDEAAHISAAWYFD